MKDSITNYYDREGYILNLILVFIGGGIGSVARYIVTTLIKNFTTINFPFGTLTVNVMGSLLMGIITALIAGKLSYDSEPVSLLLAVGFLGGFTTFSSFSIETLTLIEKHEVFYAIANILTNTTFGLLAAYLGFKFIIH